MRFRPCIDIHNGKVKQIVGGSLDDSRGALENFVSEKNPAYYANLYKERKLQGGHIVLLNKSGTIEYEQTKKEAIAALDAYPNGLQIGGGITADNAKEFIDAGASHIIVTSYLFDGTILSEPNIEKLTKAVGKDRLVFDLSCRKKADEYFVVTDRWQTYTELRVNPATMDMLSKHCDEFLIHGVDVEGMRQGIDEELLEILSNYQGLKITYAGGIRDMEDVDIIRRLGQNRVDFTVGSALDIFGGSLSFEKLCRECTE